MTSAFLDRFADEIRPKLRDRFGWTVSLSRGASTTAGVVALTDDNRGQIQSDDDIETSHVDRTWYIVKTAYLIGGEVVVPLPGDRLIDASGVVWEVLRLPAAQAVLAYGGGSEWQLRTKRIL